jgi:transposase
MRILFLPTYSPDYNPIEEAFSYVKHSLRRNQQYVDQEMGRGDDFDVVNVLLEIVYSITRRNAEGWFRHSNYIA